MPRPSWFTITVMIAAACWVGSPALAQPGEVEHEPAPAASHGEEAQPHAADAEAAHGDEHGHDGPSLFTGDLGNIFWSLVTFGLVIFFLGRFAWGPLLKALKKREDFIRESLAEAKKEREEAEARLKEYEQKITAARDEATAIVEEGRRDAEVVRQRIEREARAEADAMVKRARRDIEIARDTAVSDIYRIAANLATDAAGRIIRKELSPDDHKELIEESIKGIPERPSSN